MGRLVENIISTLVSRVAVLGLALVASVVLARGLGPEGRGLFALVMLLPEMASVFGHFGFSGANAVYAGLDVSRRRALVWHSVLLAAAGGGLFALGGALVVLGVVPGAGAFVKGSLWPYLVLLALAPVGLVGDHWRSILRGTNALRATNVLEVGSKALAVALLVTLIGWLRFGVAAAVWTECAVVLASALAAGFFLRQVGALGAPSFDRTLFKRTARFAMPTYLASICEYLYYRVDQLVIVLYLPPEQLGFYVIAVGLAERLWILPGAVANALLPHLANSRQRDGLLPAAVARHVMPWTAAAGAAIFVAGGVIVHTLYSSEFADAVAPFRVLLIGVSISTLGKVLVAELLARERVRAVLHAAAASAGVNVVITLALVPSMGIIGAAWASTLAYTLLSVMLTASYLREVGTSWRSLVPRPADLQVYRRAWASVVDTVGGRQRSMIESRRDAGHPVSGPGSAPAREERVDHAGGAREGLEDKRVNAPTSRAYRRSYWKTVVLATVFALAAGGFAVACARGAGSRWWWLLASLTGGASVFGAAVAAGGLLCLHRDARES